MLKLLLLMLSLVLAVPAANAHVGSANVYYEGDAGPYHLYVSVVLPKVVPGIAELQIRCSSPGVSSIQVVPMRLSGSGASFSAVPDRAVRSKEDPQYFVSSLWLMEFGAMKVRLTVQGTGGVAVLSVPIASYAQQSLPMSMFLRVLMLVLTLLLLGGLVLVPAALVRESTVPAGCRPGKVNLRRSRIMTTCAVLFAAFLLYAGSVAWKAQAAQYDNYLVLLKPPLAQTEVQGDILHLRSAVPLRLPLVGQDTLGDVVKMTEVLPDHGHRMHLFLVDSMGMRHMWHLHPDLADKESFMARLPYMPTGQYKIFADIVDRTGYPWTLVGDLSVPGIMGRPLSGDDSGWSGPALGSPNAPRLVSSLPGGGRIVFDRERAPVRANRPGALSFTVLGSNGVPATDLEPYMGMSAHAEVVCSDWSVFAHLHPSGSVSMPSLIMADDRVLGDTTKVMEGMAAGGSVSPQLEFPFGFPHPGEYRVFIQIKRRGNPESAAFDLHVD